MMMGPEAIASDIQKVGKQFNYASPVKCMGSVCRIKRPNLEYLGIVDGPPAPPAPPGTAKQSPLPSQWAKIDEDETDETKTGQYDRELKYSFIPETAQRELIAQLEKLFENKKVPLKAASYDRFDTSRDPQNDEIENDDSAEKHLTTVLVLKRLNEVMRALQGTTVTWAKAKIDRNLSGASATLTLPSKIQYNGHNFELHQEALNDLVNPRAGHSVDSADYANALRKAIELYAAGEKPEDERGTTAGYYLWSGGAKRAVSVVVRDAKYATQILTAYYRNSATRWFDRNKNGKTKRAERTI